MGWLTRTEVQEMYDRESVGDVRPLAASHLSLLDYLDSIDRSAVVQSEIDALDLEIELKEIVRANRAEHVPAERDPLDAELTALRRRRGGMQAALTRAQKEEEPPEAEAPHVPADIVPKPIVEPEPEEKPKPKAAARTGRKPAAKKSGKK